MSREPPDPVYILRGSNSPVTSLLYHSPSSSSSHEASSSLTPSCSLLAGTQDGNLRLWDLKTWRAVSTEEAHTAAVLSIKVKPSRPDCIITQGRDAWIHVWDVNGPSLTKTDSLRTPNPAFCQTDCLTLNAEDVVALPTENQSQVDIVSLHTKNKVMSFIPKDGSLPRGMAMHIAAVSPSSSAPFLLVGYEDGSIAAWDFRTTRELDYMKFHDEILMAFDYHLEANRGLSASVDQKLVSWTFSDNHEFTKLKDVEITNPGVRCVGYRPDGKLVVVGGWDGRVRVYSTKKQNSLVVLEQHKETVQCAAFSPDGHLAIGSKDKHISIWNIYR